MLLLEPLGVVPAFVGDAAPARPVAAGHALNTATGQARPARQNLAPLEAPAGALLASALDLTAFGNALIGRADLLPPAVAKEMRRPEPAARPGALADGWGAGLALYERDDRVWCGHDGNAQGTSCHLRADPESGVVVAFTGQRRGRDRALARSHRGTGPADRHPGARRGADRGPWPSRRAARLRGHLSQRHHDVPRRARGGRRAGPVGGRRPAHPAGLLRRPDL